jgi:HlyD family secretion protein
MIKNSGVAILLALVLPAAACEPKPRHPGALQSVVEFDERQLGFEVGGRLTAVNVRRGAIIHAGDLLATLDDTLERTSRDTREARAQAAKADVALVRAGSRPEEVRAAEAQLRAAQANESLLEQNLARERRLLERGSIARASVDDLEARLRAAAAERQSVEQRLRELRNGSRRQEIDRAEAQATVANKEVKLGDERVNLYQLRAREEGTVLDVHVDPNEVVGAGTPVVTVADTKHPYADVFVREGDLDGIRFGTPANVSIDATPRVFPARVENIGRKTEFTPRYLFSERERTNLVVRVRFRIDDPEEQLHAGVPAFVVIDRTAPTAPIEANDGRKP